MTDRGEPRQAGTPARVGLLAPAGVSLITGLYAAILLVADPQSDTAARLPNAHGMLMVLGFLGTLVALERAVALRRPVGYAAPLALGAAGLALVLPLPLLVGQLLLVIGCAATVLVLSALWQRQHDNPTAVQVLAATCALGGAVLWLRLDVADLVPWLVAYLVLTIAAERIELARLALPPRASRVLLTLAGAVPAAVVAALLWPAVGARLLGLALLALTGWLARVDVARRTIRSSGLPRYAAAALLLGYGWLAVAAVTWLVGGPPRSERAYDTVVHASFLGFAMSMVLAHAPVILPAVLRRPLPYRTAMWIPLALLHIGLLTRIGAGNGLGQHTAWQLGSWVTVGALLVFVGTAAWSTLTAPRTRPGAATPERPRSATRPTEAPGSVTSR